MYDWLKNYDQLEAEIAYLKLNLERTEAERRRWVYGDLKNISLNEKSKGAKVEEEIRRIENELKEKEKQKEQLIRFISNLTGLDNKILKMKYIDGMRLEDIARETQYSMSHVKKRHAELIKTIKIVELYKKGSL